MRTLRDVVVFDPKWTAEIFQSFYLDRGRKRIKPNVVVLKPPNMALYFETNSYGLKGSEVDPTKRLAAVWGDSVVFGLGRGWVEDLDKFFAGFQFLNGGLEGDGLENIRARAMESNGKVEIDFNIVFPGWHTMKSPRKVRSILSSMVDHLPGPILCTVPTSLSERVTDMDLTSYFTTTENSKHPAYDPLGTEQEGDESSHTSEVERNFFFWGNLKYSIKNAKRLLHQLQEQNGIVRELARKRNVPLVDLYEHFYTDDISRFRDEFFDAGHPRPGSYPKIQLCFSEVLKSVLV